MARDINQELWGQCHCPGEMLIPGCAAASLLFLKLEKEI